MKNIIAGTAGHIDHGKTALVRALTGIDTDRLEEEKRRGISIDIGFAHLELAPDVRVGFVDVPGHERFVRNMLAGVGGIDLVLLVIAADEGVKPQTREHFDICRLLAIPRGIIVLTKADLVDPDTLGLARLEAEDLVKGSFLEGAAIVPASSTTGSGLNELKQRLLELARAIREKDASRHFRLPVDRAFSIHGFGTVVTGTLVSGKTAREQEVELHPGGRRLRVRGIQVHGAPAEAALAGQRTALNLAGVEAAEIGRGMTLTAPGLFAPVERIDARLDLLTSAKPLRHRAPVHFHAGTAEVEAEVRLLDGGAEMRPGASGYVRLVLREPLLLLPGDRFIVRMFSPVVTIAGGVVVDISGRRYRAEEDAAARLRILEQAGPEERVALLVRESRFGLGLPELIATTGLLPAEIERAAAAPSLLAIRHPQFWLLARDWAAARIEAMRRAVAAFHAQNPLAEGIAKETLRAAELAGAPPFLLDALIAQAADLLASAEVVRAAGHRVVLQQDEEQATRQMETVFQQAGLAVPTLNEALAKSGLPPARSRPLLQRLIREGRLVKISEDLVFHRAALEALRGRLAPLQGQRIGVPQFKDLAGISRKYAIPLLEYLDRIRVTRRDGDQRIVL